MVQQEHRSPHAYSDKAIARLGADESAMINATQFVVALAELLSRHGVSTAEKARERMFHILPLIGGLPR
jgi:hypothetical protein